MAYIAALYKDGEYMSSGPGGRQVYARADNIKELKRQARDAGADAMVVYRARKDGTDGALHGYYFRYGYFRWDLAIYSPAVTSMYAPTYSPDAADAAFRRDLRTHAERAQRIREAGERAADERRRNKIAEIQAFNDWVKDRTGTFFPTHLIEEYVDQRKDEQ